MLDINILLKKELDNKQKMTIRGGIKIFVAVFLAFCLSVITWFASSSFRYEFTFGHVFEKKTQVEVL